jgi:hypothetical protein
MQSGLYRFVYILELTVKIWFSKGKIFVILYFLCLIYTYFINEEYIFVTFLYHGLANWILFFIARTDLDENIFRFYKVFNISRLERYLAKALLLTGFFSFQII